MLMLCWLPDMTVSITDQWHLHLVIVISLVTNIVESKLKFGVTLILRADCPVLCLGGGTPHKPAMLSGTGHVIHEASAYAAYLKEKAGNIP